MVMYGVKIAQGSEPPQMGWYGDRTIAWTIPNSNLRARIAVRVSRARWTVARWECTGTNRICGQLQRQQSSGAHMWQRCAGQEGRYARVIVV